MKKDHYEVLGVPKSASDEDIKKAYKREALRHHPDRNPGDAKAEERFKEVNTAWNCLSDPEKKAEYDRPGPAAWPPPAGGKRTGSPFDVDSVFNFKDFFPNPFGGGPKVRTERPAPSPGRDVETTVRITVVESLSGLKKAVRFQGSIPCDSCGKESTTRYACQSCGGLGTTINLGKLGPGVAKCASCMGRGWKPGKECRKCDGSGQKEVWREVSVTVPRGVRPGAAMKLKGMGRPGSPPGDLMMTLEVVDADGWKVRGTELHTLMSVDLGTLVRGGMVEIRMPDGSTVEVHVPRGGGQSTVKGAWKNPNGPDGDMVVTFNVSPVSVSPRAERLLKELMEETSGRPR